MWIKLCTWNFIVLDNSQDFVSLRNQLRAEESSVVFEKIVTLWIFCHCLLPHKFVASNCILLAKSLVNKTSKICVTFLIYIELDMSEDQFLVEFVTSYMGSQIAPFVEWYSTVSSCFNEIDFIRINVKLKDHRNMIIIWESYCSYQLWSTFAASK